MSNRILLIEYMFYKAVGITIRLVETLILSGSLCISTASKLKRDSLRINIWHSCGCIIDALGNLRALLAKKIMTLRCLYFKTLTTNALRP